MAEYFFLFFILAMASFPIGFITLCLTMIFFRVWWFTYFAYFIVFGSFGEWSLTMAAVFMGPGAGPLAGIGMESLLLTCAMSLCLVSSVILQFRKQKSRFDYGAMLGGYAFVVLHSAFFTYLFWLPKGAS